MSAEKQLVRLLCSIALRNSFALFLAIILSFHLIILKHVLIKPISLKFVDIVDIVTQM